MGMVRSVQAVIAYSHSCSRHHRRRVFVASRRAAPSTLEAEGEKVCILVAAAFTVRDIACRTTVLIILRLAFDRRARARPSSALLRFSPGRTPPLGAAK
jgi:hypothetical protein